MNDPPRGQVKTDILLDQALQCKTIIQYPNLLLLTIVDSFLIGNTIIRDNIHSAPFRT